MKWVKGQEVDKLHSSPSPASEKIPALREMHLDSVDFWRLRVQMLLHRVFLRTGIELRVLSHSLRFLLLVRQRRSRVWWWHMLGTQHLED